MELREKISKAARLLELGKNDEAIQILQSDESPKDADSLALLARAYAQRGDVRGDVHASQFFAKRAAEFRAKTDELRAIQAIGDFRKERYDEAAKEFAHFVSEKSPASSQFLFGLSLLYTGREADGRTWLERAAKKDPRLQAKIEEAGRYFRKPGEMKRPPAGNMYESVIDRLRASDGREIPAPYAHQPLSTFRGTGSEPRDLDWSAKNVPCQDHCPAGTNIPEYLDAIYRGEYDRAYRINLWDNVFPGMLGRVCARPCEEKCRHGWEGLGQSVAICWSKRSASDHREPAFVKLPSLFEPSGKRVGVVGSGVAGLAVARQLALLGHEVTVYEKHKRPGGMMNQGIPEFRLPRDVVAREIEQVKACGVTIECGKGIGKDIPLSTLYETFDAVVLAAGTLDPNKLDLPGANLSGIQHGLEFLLEVNEFGRTAIGKKVIVIGGGFTAMDCARTAWRLGVGSVRVLYRRSSREMLITPGELEELEQEGISMEFMISPVEYLGDKQGRLRAVKFVKNELGDPDGSGRRRPVPIQGSEFEVEADTVLLATGQFPDTAWIDGALREKLVDGEGHRLCSGEFRTPDEKIFMAGDFSLGASSLILAIGHAKKAARAVDLFLTGQDRLKDVVRVEDAPATGRIREMDAVPLTAMPSLDVEDRTLKAEVEKGLTKELAVEEAQRCYLCHYKFEIDHDRCIYCDWCIKAMPRPNCILKVKELVRDAQGRTVNFEIARTSEEVKYIYINQEDCIRCHACVLACPVHCIHVQKVTKDTVPCAGSPGTARNAEQALTAWFHEAETAG